MNHLPAADLGQGMTSVSPLVKRTTLIPSFHLGSLTLMGMKFANDGEINMCLYIRNDSIQ